MFLNHISRLIKLASSLLNNLIGIGAIVLYISTITQVIPTTDRTFNTCLCNITPWLSAIGYSLCYGTIMAKMMRVYYIFNYPSIKKKVSDRNKDCDYQGLIPKRGWGVFEGTGLRNVFWEAIMYVNLRG